MAQTFADAFDLVAGDDLDHAAGYVKTRPLPAPVSEQRRRNWARLPNWELGRMVGQVATNTGSTVHDAEEAVYGTLARMMENDPDRFDAVEAKRLLGAVKRISEKDVQRLKRERGLAGGLSLDLIIDATPKDGDQSPLNSVAVVPMVAHFKAGVDETARHVPRPKAKADWTRTQAIGAVQRFRDATGRGPSGQELDDNPDLPGWGTIKHLGFKNLQDLLIEAGVPVGFVKSRARWIAEDAASSCYSHRRRTGFWPNGEDAKYLPVGTLPPAFTMRRLWGGSSSTAVQLGVEAMLGPIDQPTWEPDGSLTRRLAREHSLCEAEAS
jgi:hypothetical protein